MPSVRVVIVNFNVGEVLSDCVEAVLSSAECTTVTVADNASEDGSMDALEARWGDDQRLQTVYNGKNIGFGSAVNRVAEAVSEDYLLILNPDCILAEGSLEQLVLALEQDKSAAIAGPWVTEPDGRVQSGTWRRLPDPWMSFKHLTGLHRLSGHLPSLSGGE